MTDASFNIETGQTCFVDVNFQCEFREKNSVKNKNRKKTDKTVSSASENGLYNI